MHTLDAAILCKAQADRAFLSPAFPYHPWAPNPSQTAMRSSVGTRMPPRTLYYSLVGAFFLHCAEAKGGGGKSGGSSSGGTITIGNTVIPAKWIVVPSVLIAIILISICCRKVGCAWCCTRCDLARERRYRTLLQRERQRAAAAGETGATDTSGLGNTSIGHRPRDTIDKDGVIRLGRDPEEGHTPTKAETVPPPYSPPMPNSAYQEMEAGGSSALHYAPPSYPHPTYPPAHLHADMETFPLTTHQA